MEYHHQGGSDHESQHQKYGIYSHSIMADGGFTYTGRDDCAKCTVCNLEVSGWTREMDPFSVHLERSPHCRFVQSVQAKHKLEPSIGEQSRKRQKVETNVNPLNQQQAFMESSILKQVRERTFSHWPKETTLSKEKMIAAGFFQCNVGDRVICLYCNLVCQYWDETKDNPIQVHAALQPQCPYVMHVLMQTYPSSYMAESANLAVTMTDQTSSISYNIDCLGFDQSPNLSPCHPSLMHADDRKETFKSLSDVSTSAIDELVRAGFFYTGARDIVDCFYCNGRLQNFIVNSDPLTEHIRLFPHCLYAKEIAGVDLYTRIIQDTTTSNTSTSPSHNLSSSNQPILEGNDSRLLNRLVAARLDLPASRKLSDKTFSPVIVKRCWEDQLRLKKDDFVTDCDLLIACLILQKQIDCIKGKKDNVIVPSTKVKCNQEQQVHSDTSTMSDEPPMSISVPSTPTNESTINTEPTLCRSISKADSTDMDITQASETSTNSPAVGTTLPISNPCVLCWKEEKHLACIPCGHLATCIHCGQILRTCPICRRKIDAFVRVYI